MLDQRKRRNPVSPKRLFVGLNYIQMISLINKNTFENLFPTVRHKEQEKKMETIVRENDPIDLGDRVVKACKFSYQILLYYSVI